MKPSDCSAVDKDGVLFVCFCIIKEKTLRKKLRNVRMLPFLDFTLCGSG